jgi:hypothetical protein
MSAGPFQLSRYERDNADIHPIRVQPETIIGGTNPAPGGAPTSDISARVSGGRRTLGLTARKVRFVFTAGAPTGYRPGSVLTLPVLTPAAYAALTRGSTFTYLGGTATVVGKSPEYVN